MAWIARTLVLATGIAGGVVTSQAPEFAQQYRQRLGGALQELRVVVEAFDADASRSGLGRAEALAAYRASADDFLRDRGVSIARTIARYDSLRLQAARFETWPEALRPAILAGEVDADLVRGTWRDFRPGVPVTVSGAIWAAVGFLLGLLLARGAGAAGRGIAGPARRRGVPATRQGIAAHAAVASGSAPEVVPDPDGPVVDDGRHVRH
ncbi:DUF2937 family protein [Oricola thermophila]|uniref:DUF2937 family protein n=1 Tax=Oricola thermophila TaxID=2742145 RepID=A0A6N1VIJ5_9HYPH|nr:DUF2937 family protein [Oricola thermophila]QKV18807.1 DUF2937 family protein [Oricola thermophila]